MTEAPCIMIISQDSKAARYGAEISVCKLLLVDLALRSGGDIWPHDFFMTSPGKLSK